MSISILVSGAGIVSLGGTADASKLATGDPKKAILLLWEFLNWEFLTGSF